ncbi:16601_t:CDS:2 [Funneliformis caledonium]|uniref:16601_t:CDS:1 n=1 Tax=Funneliformis caledonium TaxID=1117310 RepID=A0A9N9GUC4_9GLOM|nr:16601_t:CDS:2 [Funneliformis caledonium]
MSRSSWFGFSIVEQSFAEQNNNDNTLSSIDSQNNDNNISSSSPIKEQGCSENIISETASDTSTTTLVEPSSIPTNNCQTSNAIPIPKNPNSRVRNYDEQKNKSFSSFKSWWSTSSSSFNQKEQTISIPNTTIQNNLTEEKQKSLTGSNTSTNQNNDKSRSVRHDKQLLRQDNGSSISILTPINENGPDEKKHSQPIEVEITGSNSRENGQKKPRSSDADIVDKNSTLIGKTSDAKLSSSYSSMSSTTSSRGWWMFGGGNCTSSREDVSSNNLTISNTAKPENIISNRLTSEPTQFNTENKQTDQISIVSKNSNLTNHILTTTSDDGNSTSTGSTRRVKKKSSSEIRRWSLFGTWSPSTTNLEFTNEGESSKDAGEDDKSKSKFHSLPTSSSATKSEPTTSSNNVNVNPSKKGPIKEEKQNEHSSKDSENNDKKSPQCSHKRPTNPIIQTLPENRSSWLHFFTNASHTQSKSAKIENASDRKMITNGSSSPSEKGSANTANDSKNSLKVSTTVEVEKKISVDSSSVSVPPKLKPVPVNVLLPTFEEFAENKPRRHPNSMVQKTLHAINTYFFPPDRLPESTLPKWLDEITRSTVDVKRIAIIGVHGWFPAKSLRAVFGEPTGTSPKFCDMMAKAVLGYLSQHGNILPSDSITCIPLEGEGTISTREELLYQNLSKNKTWCEALSFADVVFVATHSQGTPVSTILLSRLIKEGLVHPKRQRICMLAMAGISHGPFPYLKENYIVKYFVGAGRSHDADAARELFEFMDSDSLVSKKYREALNVIIQRGVKLIYVASMDDQVVPVLDHPSIMRSIYIDGPLYQPNDFLTNLIVFAIRLRNAGILDHGLMVQLSEVVAGSMYGEGHSALYNEINVYTSAVRYLFETPSLSYCNVKLERFQAQQKNNPYYLPWAMRGILEDRGVLESNKFAHEILKLRKQYEDWEPVSKVMKDVKFRLEPLKDAILRRSKL